ncbi:MAG: DNA primase [Rhodospirillales bacterium]
MSLPQAFLDELRARVGLVALIGRRVRLQRKGREHQGLCPFHNEKTPSFTVNEDKGFYHCFGCGAHGDALSFVMQSEGLSFPDAVERLAGEAGMEVPQPSPEAKAAADRQSTLLEVVEAATKLFQEALSGPEGGEARSYLAGRGLSAKTLADFRLGFAPSRRGFLVEGLARQGIGKALLLEAGLAKRDEQSEALREYFFGRVIFPIFDRRGRPVAFGGRRLGEQGPKYLNSPDSTLFHKGQLLYNLDRAKVALRGAEQRLLVVEGYMDVIALAQAGLGAAVAPLGTAMTEAQVAETWRLTDTPLICLDGDEAGRRAAHRLVERVLPILTPGKSLAFAFLPEGEDPDSVLRALGRPALERRLDESLPLAKQVWERLVGAGLPTTPERWAALKSDLLKEVARIADNGVQESYRAHLLDLFFAARRGGRGDPGSFKQWRGHQGKGRRGAALPAAPDRDKPDPDDQRLRPERELMALVLAHPGLAAAHIEALADIECQAESLAKMKTAAIDCLATQPELDSEALRRQLSKLGYSALLDHILSPAVYLLCPAARPEAAEDQAERMLETLLADFDGKRADAAVMEAQARVADDPNDDTMAGLMAALRAREAAEERRARLAER